MSTAQTIPVTTWTVGDLMDRFGPIPLSRVLFDPPPGTATEEDLVRLCETGNSLYELIDGTLVEKAMGWYEGRLAAYLLQMIGGFAEPKGLGIVVGADGLTRFSPNIIRLPDVSYISVDQLPDGVVPQVAVSNIVPAWVIEVISEGNTSAEMQRKLEEYFQAGVKLVWYVDARRREVRCYTSLSHETIITESGELTAGGVLPGFTLSAQEFFNQPNILKGKS